MPKISVIVPVYNTEKYLDKCLNSIINQTYQDFEVILVDDGSTDNSKEIIGKYLKKYPILINYYYIEHSGVANARNFGISKTKGDYFLFVDSDDFIDLNLLFELNKYINTNSNIDIIKYKMQIVEENKIEKISGPIFSTTTGENAFNLLCFTDVLIDTPCLYLIKTSFFKSNNFRFLENTYREDFGLIPLLIVTAKNVMSIELYGYKYFKSDNSIMRNSDYKKTIKKAEDLFLHYENMINYIETINLNKLTIQNLKQYYTNGILLSFKYVNKKDRKQLILKFKDKKMVNNIIPQNLKQLLKKFILNISVNLYLFLA